MSFESENEEMPEVKTFTQAKTDIKKTVKTVNKIRAGMIERKKKKIPKEVKLKSKKDSKKPKQKLFQEDELEIEQELNNLIDEKLTPKQLNKMKQIDLKQNYVMNSKTKILKQNELTKEKVIDENTKLVLVNKNYNHQIVNPKINKFIWDQIYAKNQFKRIPLTKIISKKK